MRRADNFFLQTIINKLKTVIILESQRRSDFSNTMKIILPILTMIFTMLTISAQTMPPLETGVSQTLARWRAANYSDVRYKLNITLEKGAPLMKGTIEVSVKLTDEGAKNDLILDWRTTQFANDKDKPFAKVTAINDYSTANSTESVIDDKHLNEDHLIISRQLLKTGENVIKINFASPIKTSGAAVTRYVDKEDGAEYVYSLFVPSDASTAFPVFDQPDLKARFTLGVVIPQSLNWKIVTNTPLKSFLSPYCVQPSVRADPASDANGFVIDEKQSSSEVTAINNPKSENQDIRGCGKGYLFEETKPISTYVFAFAAGDFAEVSEPSAVADGLTRRTENSNKNSNVSNAKLQPPATAGGSDTPTNLPMKIYVRKSQAEKFKQHAAEVFRLNREGVKFLEGWFDYKFPFPKYDLVLLPEFPFGGMEHAGATFLREDRVIFPTEPTKNDYITRANVIFHEAAHQWFGDTVTMKWFDDLWLKEGFAEFMAYKTMEKVMPEYNAWKIFYERNKQAAYLTDSTRGTTPIYQEIPNLSAAKSAYGNIVYRKAPSFLRQAEFYLGEDKFQTAVRAFLKKHEFANAEWTDLVNEFAEVKVAELKSRDDYQKTLSAKQKEKAELGIEREINEWADIWVKKPGVPIIKVRCYDEPSPLNVSCAFRQINSASVDGGWIINSQILRIKNNGERETLSLFLSNSQNDDSSRIISSARTTQADNVAFEFLNYQDYGYGIFLLDEKSRAYVLENIQTEKDDFLRSMMWGSLWDSVRFYELAPADYVALVIKNINVETDESTIQTLLGRVSTAMNYYLIDAQSKQFAPEIEKLLLEKMQNAPTLGQKITFYRAFISLASSANARNILKQALADSGTDIAENSEYKQRHIKLEATAIYKLFPPLKAKDKFDIVTKLITLGDPDGLKLLAELEKTEPDDASKRYAYAAQAGIATKENKAKFWNDFVGNKEISESYIESALGAFNAPRQADLTLPYLEKSLAELPNLKKNRKIFFVNGWLSAFIGGQKSAEALAIVNKFLADNPNLDKDLRLKILENSDNLERAVKIREKFGK